ncbi:MAG: glyoxylate/hydroxypyruvate reductase A [Rhodobacteraceae bacterium]|jgi:glyoxylate/hydroxypyruvate reductase A|nr:glyoxylate/hydroxypyruvate reductase A [Paracoccaceae bacterium]
MQDQIRIFIASKGDPAGLAHGFLSEFPDAQIFTATDGLDAGPVPYLVVGKPDPGVIARVPGLELVLSLNAGVDHLLKGDEIPAGVPIVRMVDPAMTEGMSDWVLAVVLSWHRNLALYRADATWTRRNEVLSRDRIVTVLGAGTLGGRVGRLLALVGFQTRVWSRSGRAVEGATAFAGADGLVQATTGAHAVVNLLPLTDETRGILDAALFARMAPGGFVASAGRGEHLVDADLIAALDAGQLSEAALDVFRTEPLPGDHALWRHPRVLVTPHVAAPTQPGSAIRIMAETIRRHRSGAPLDHLAHRDRGY